MDCCEYGTWLSAWTFFDPGPDPDPDIRLSSWNRKSNNREVFVTLQTLWRYLNQEFMFTLK
jgi:hypothetical protein